MKEKKQIALEKFDIFIGWVKNELISQRQLELLEDCRNSLEADFDCEITYLRNCKRISEML